VIFNGRADGGRSFRAKAWAVGFDSQNPGSIVSPPGAWGCRKPP
jgi:hypothetical protein